MGGSLEQSLGHACQRGTVRLHRLWQFQAMASCQNSSRMVPQITREQHLHARLHLLGRDFHSLDKFPNACRIDIDAIALAPLHHLGVASDDGNPCQLGHFPHGMSDFPQVLHREAFLQDYPGRDVPGHSPCHGQVIHRATNCQLTYIAAIEEQGLHHIGIRGEGQLA